MPRFIVSAIREVEYVVEAESAEAAKAAMKRDCAADEDYLTSDSEWYATHVLPATPSTNDPDMGVVDGRLAAYSDYVEHLNRKGGGQ